MKKCIVGPALESMASIGLRAIAEDKRNNRKWFWGNICAILALIASLSLGFFGAIWIILMFLFSGTIVWCLIDMWCFHTLFQKQVESLNELLGYELKPGMSEEEIRKLALYHQAMYFVLSYSAKITREGVDPEFAFLRADAKKADSLAFDSRDIFSFFNIEHCDPEYPPFLLKSVCFVMSDYVALRILSDGYHPTMDKVKTNLKDAIDKLYEK